MGGTDSFALDINDNGQVVGTADTPGNTAFHAFLYSGGAMADLGTLGGAMSMAHGINDNGQVVGTAAILGNTTSHAFIYSGGAMADLGTLGGAVSIAHGINDNGQVVGWADTAAAAPHAFIYSGGAMVNLGTLGGIGSAALAINDGGQVVGFSATIGDLAQHAFLYSGGAMIDLGTFGGNYSIADDINNSGQVVGAAVTAGNYPVTPGNGALIHAFLYSANQMLDLNTLADPGSGWILQEATSINDAGLITAIGYNPQTNKQSFFLLSPHATVPTPSTLWLVGVGLLGIAGRRRETTKDLAI